MICRISKDFVDEEFFCNDLYRTPVPSKYQFNLVDLVSQLQIMRDRIGLPFRISSGYRTALHNQIVGGEKNSQHLYCKAADIETPIGIRLVDFQDSFDEAMNGGIIINGGLGRYTWGLHYDIGPGPRRWDRRNKG